MGRALFHLVIDLLVSVHKINVYTAVFVYNQLPVSTCLEITTICLKTKCCVKLAATLILDTTDIFLIKM